MVWRLNPVFAMSGLLFNYKYWISEIEKARAKAAVVFERGQLIVSDEFNYNLNLRIKTTILGMKKRFYCPCSLDCLELSVIGKCQRN